MLASTKALKHTQHRYIKSHCKAIVQGFKTFNSTINDDDGDKGNISLNVCKQTNTNNFAPDIHILCHGTNDKSIQY